ncbi:MAG: DUF1566 domain-containing protein [Bacteriovoracia bacterium]
MNHAFLSVLLAMGVLFGCSHFQDTKRIPAAIRDVGVIGPDGEVILYYREGDYIIVRLCDPNTILGMTSAQARSNCQGKSNKVPVESFKQSIRNLVSTARLNVLKPLTPKEVEANSSGNLSSDEIEAMVIELEKINDFITVYGPVNANLVRKEELIKALRTQETRVRAIIKINAEVEKAVNLIINNTKLTLIKYSSDKDQFLYTVLKQFSPKQNFPCGLEGSVEERIKDCSFQLTSEKEGFVLVTRTKDFKEVHKEVSTGLLWSDRLPSTMNHYDAEKACMADPKEFAGISGVTWRLPSIKEYEQAEKNGIRKALPNMNDWFWSSSIYPDYPDWGWLFVGYLGKIGDSPRDADYFWVRCVARINSKVRYP